MEHTGRSYMKFDIFRKSLEKIQVSLKSDKNKGFCTWSRPIYIFDHIWLSSSHSEDCVRRKLEKIEKHILWSVTFFRKSVRCRKVVQSGRPQMTIWRMRIEYWIPKATNTDSEYLIPIAFPQQHWLHERFSLLHFASLIVVHFTWQLFVVSKRDLVNNCKPQFPKSVRTSFYLNHVLPPHCSMR